MLPLLLSSRPGLHTAAVTAASPQLLRHLNCQAFPGHTTNWSWLSAGSSRNNNKHRAGIAAVAAAAALCSILQSKPAQADAVADDAADISRTSDAAKRAQFTAWLTSRGADMSAVAVQQSSDQDSGLGLFATPAIKQHMTHSWLGRRVGSMLLRGASNQTVQVASIPLDLSLTIDTALSHTQLGPQFAELLELGLIDERTAVVLLLMVERARGEASPYAPWLQLLPTRFNTPLFYSDAQLQELSGTTLAAAAAARKASLSRSWQQLKPAAQAMIEQVGVSGEPSYEDYLWATSIFWSRGLALPVTYTDAADQQQQQQQHNGTSSSSSSNSSGVLRIKVLEGLVPGLDLANHSSQPKCWWEVEQVDSKQQKQQQGQQQELLQAAHSQHVVKLMANRACCPAVGDELTISYGDKGNEELLLLYGFAQPQNPHETLMVLCPLPDPDDWDETFTARMHLLQAKGLRPQIFLSAQHFEAATGQSLLVDPTAPVPESDSSTIAAEAPSSSSSTTRSAAGGNRASIVPEAAREVLEVFVLDRGELAAALEQQQEGAQWRATGGDSSSTDPMQQRMQQLGLQMAVLTTFTRLLELKMIAMEGDEGTGPLENDLRELAETDAAAAAAARQMRRASSDSDGSNWADEGAGGMPVWRRHCLLYRAGQKALVRSFITAARAELQETLKLLQGLMEAKGEYSS